MRRVAILGLLAVLVPALPAFAGGPRVTVSWIMPRQTLTPASLPFVVGTRPFTASGVVVPPSSTGPVAVIREHRHHQRPATTTFISSPTTTQIVVVPQPAPVVVPQTVYLVPQECATQGSWSYRWIPFVTTQNVWVPGSWAADGTWTDSRWESRPYASGYYEPFWVPGQSYGC